MASLLACSTGGAFLPSLRASSSSSSSSSCSLQINNSLTESVSLLPFRFCNDLELGSSLTLKPTRNFLQLPSGNFRYRETANMKREETTTTSSRASSSLSSSPSPSQGAAALENGKKKKKTFPEGNFPYRDAGSMKRERTTTCRASSSSSSSPSPSQGAATLEKGKKKETLPEGFIEEMKAFLRRDLIHLFDEQGIDKSMYDPKVEFRDPITNYDSLEGYLFNIQMLRRLFHPIFELHTVKQTGPYEITTRWTMTMNFWIVLWQPKLIFTGVSIMRINPETGKFCAHIDHWDSIKDNEYFSFEGAMDIIRQMQYFKTPDLETPKYRVLKRTAVYQVREYEPFIVVETEGDALSGSRGFNAVAGYIFGKNDKEEKMKMTTPVFTEQIDQFSTSGVKLQIVLPLQSCLSELPAPLSEQVKVQQVERRVLAAVRFNGKPTEDGVQEKVKILTEALAKDELRQKGGMALARYNDPGRTFPLFMKNEVLACLEDFELD